MMKGQPLWKRFHLLFCESWKAIVSGSNIPSRRVKKKHSVYSDQNIYISAMGPVVQRLDSAIHRIVIYFKPSEQPVCIGLTQNRSWYFKVKLSFYQLSDQYLQFYGFLSFFKAVQKMVIRWKVLFSLRTTDPRTLGMQGF